MFIYILFIYLIYVYIYQKASSACKYLLLLSTPNMYLYVLTSIERLRKWSQFGTAIEWLIIIQNEWLDAAHYQFSE
jgi:hypothetical protein